MFRKTRNRKKIKGDENKMNFKEFFKTCFSLCLIIFLFSVLTVFFHEATHIALNDFRFDGVCAFNCNKMVSDGLLGNGYTPFGVYLNYPINPLAENELVAWISGYFFAITITLFLIIKKVIE